MSSSGEGLKELRSQVEAALSVGDVDTARVLVERLWRRCPGPSAASFINARLTALQIPVRRRANIAFLRSFTVEPIVPLLAAGAAINGLGLSVHLGDFGTYTQEVLDPGSELYTSWNPDVVILAVQTRDIAPELWSTFADLAPVDVETIVARVLAEYATLIQTFRTHSMAALVVHGLEQAPTRSLGVAELTSHHGQVAAIDRINKGLTQLAHEHPAVHVLDVDGLVATAGRRQWYDERKWASMRMPIRAECMADLAAEWLRYIQPLTGHVAKVLAVDLDNTLWGGVIGEDGLDGIVLGGHAGTAYSNLQREIRDLKARGVLLAVCSKNNLDDAREVFDRHPDSVLQWSDFAAIRANWSDKADNLRSIANELNIGTDAIAFLDDNPSECARVRSAVPDVIVLEHRFESSSDSSPIAGNPFFERLALSGEDSERNRMYAEQAERRQNEASATSLVDYLHSLEMTVVISEASSDDVRRVAQLTQKTNQFNLTTRRYTEPEIGALQESPDWKVLVARARDRFGEHGLIGVIIADTTSPEWSIDTFLMSCRVIGRGVETAMLASLSEMAASAGARVLVGEYRRSAKNAPASQFYGAHGFEFAGEDDASSTWRYVPIPGQMRSPDWIQSGDAVEGATRG